MKNISRKIENEKIFNAKGNVPRISNLSSHFFLDGGGGLKSNKEGSSGDQVATK